MLTLLLASLAHGTTYTTTLPVVRSAPTHGPSTQRWVTVQSWDVGTTQSNQTVTSNWSYITCEVDNGSIVAVFKATPATWPTSFPSTATCTGGGHSLVLTLTAAPEPYPDYDDQLVPSIGITLNADGNTWFWRNYELPATTTYEAGSWPAKLGPSTTWPGVTCKMKFGAGGTPWLQLVVDETATENEGFCVLQRTASPNLSIDLTINR